MVPGLRVGGGLGSVAVPWLPPSVSWHAADARRPVHVGNAAGRRACEGRTAAQFQGQTYFGYPNRTGLAAFGCPTRTAHSPRSLSKAAPAASNPKP